MCLKINKFYIWYLSYFINKLLCVFSQAMELNYLDLINKHVNQVLSSFIQIQQSETIIESTLMWFLYCLCKKSPPVSRFKIKVFYLSFRILFQSGTNWFKFAAMAILSKGSLLCYIIIFSTWLMQLFMICK